VYRKDEEGRQRRKKRCGLVDVLFHSVTFREQFFETEELNTAHRRKVVSSRHAVNVNGLLISQTTTVNILLKNLNLCERVSLFIFYRLK